MVNDSMRNTRAASALQNAFGNAGMAALKTAFGSVTVAFVLTDATLSASLGHHARREALLMTCSKPLATDVAHETPLFSDARDEASLTDVSQVALVGAGVRVRGQGKARESR